MKIQCRFDVECKGFVRARGLCTKHYQQMRVAGRIEEFAPTRISVDAVQPCSDCGEPSRQRGLRCHNCSYKKFGQKSCDGCGEPIPKENPTGLCRDICAIPIRLSKSGVFGVIPSPEETSIYVLKQDNVIFYVGSSKDPLHRIRTHKPRFGKNIELHIVRNVLDDLAVIEECREIVFRHDSGLFLENRQTPHPQI